MPISAIGLGAGGAGEKGPSIPFGYKGRVIVFGVPVRATTMSIDAKQPITVPEPTSNIPEQPMWHVGPVRVDGDVSFPMTSDPGIRNLFLRALEKKNKQLEPGEVLSEWPRGQGGGGPVLQPFGRRFTGCVANRLILKGVSGERIDVTMAIMGVGVDDEAIGVSPSQFDLSRVISWDMIEVNGVQAGRQIAETCSIREFSVEINNNCSHNFTFNFPDGDETFITARSVTTGRRQITGSLSFVGTAPTQETAKKNLITAIPEDELIITIAPPREGNITDVGPAIVDPSERSNIEMKFKRLVYEWQDLSLSSGVVVSRVDWRAHGDGPGTVAAEFTF